MGLLRLILALTVVSEHIFPTWFWGIQNVLAVKAFFVISGFYMALILADRYRDATVRFYINRFARLLPLHLVVLAIMVGLIAVAPKLIGLPLVNTSVWSIVFGSPDLYWLGGLLVLANISLVGSDLTNFTCLDPTTHRVFLEGPDPIGTLQPCLGHGVALSAFLINGPMWTIGIELLFYLMAPLLARRSTPALIGIVAIAALPRIWLIYSGLAPLPWYRGVAAFELIYFFLGMLAYRLYERVRQHPPSRRWLAVVTASAIILTIVGSPSWDWLYIAGLAATLPFLFLATSRSRVDRYLGDLSYPVYVCQWLVLGIMNGGLTVIQAQAGVGVWTAANVLAVVLVAMTCERVVVRPVERVRHQLADAAAAYLTRRRSRTAALDVTPLIAEASAAAVER